MEEDPGSGKARVEETPAVFAAVQIDAGSSSSSQPPPATRNDDGIPQGGWKREEPESLRQLSAAMEGWKNKQEQIHKKFMEEFDNLGRDISQMQHDTVNFKSEVDIVKDGLHGRTSANRDLHTRSSLLAASTKSLKDVPNSHDVQK